MRLVSYLSPGYPPALFEALGDVVGAEVDFVTGRSGPDPLADPFLAGDADFGWICATSFVELTSGPMPSVRLVGVAWVPADPDAHGRPVYFSDVLARPDSGIEHVEQLAGRRIGCNDVASLSGYHALRIELARHGHDPDRFAELVLTGGHLESIDLLLRGELDAVVVDSVVRTRHLRDRADVDLRVLSRLGPWPTQPLVVRVDASADASGRVRDALVAADRDPEIRALLAESGLARLVETSSSHYDGVRRAMTEVPPAIQVGSQSGPM